MPNHCNNTLTITSSSEAVDELLKEYITTNSKGEQFLDFEKIIPKPSSIQFSSELSSHELVMATNNLPDELKQSFESLKEKVSQYNLKNHGVDGWYDWCVANWGTKWNSYDCIINEDGISFNTAWSPATPIVAELAKLIKQDLILTYIEEGCDFVGEFSAFANGEIEDDCYTIDTAPQELLDQVGYEKWEYEE